MGKIQEVLKHLKGDVVGFKKEAKEDKKLIKKLMKGKHNGKEERCACSEGKKRVVRKGRKSTQKAGRLKRRKV